MTTRLGFRGRLQSASKAPARTKATTSGTFVLIAFGEEWHRPAPGLRYSTVCGLDSRGAVEYQTTGVMLARLVCPVCQSASKAPKRPAPDEERVLTLDEAKALPGFLGRIAPAMLQHHGVYGYTEHPSGRKVLLRLARCGNCGMAIRADDASADEQNGHPIHAMCFVPDISGPKYRGTLSDFIVAPPNARNVTPSPRLLAQD